MPHQTLLVYAEQGLGDTLQFVRYLPRVAAPGTHVVLACQPALVRLLRTCPGVQTLVVKDRRRWRVSHLTCTFPS